MITDSVTKLTPQQGRDLLTELRNEIHRHIVGQDRLIERLLVSILADGHLLQEILGGSCVSEQVEPTFWPAVFHTPNDRVTSALPAARPREKLPAAAVDHEHSPVPPLTEAN